VLTPRDVSEVADAVVAARTGGRTAKMVGAGHSFTAIGAPEGVMLRPEKLTGITRVDRDAMTVTALAGTPLHALNAALEHLGLSLHNMGDIAEQTLAGAISTGTHGTGGVAAGLSAQVAGLQLVTGTGELLTATADENGDVLDLARSGLGALGVLTTITFRVEPLFVLEAHEQPMTWEQAVASFDEIAAANHHVDLYWFPHTDRVLAKQNNRLDAALDEAEPLSRARAWFDDELLANRAFALLCLGSNQVPGVIPHMNRLTSRLLTERRYSDVAHRVFTSSRTVVFKEMEYAVPRAAGVAALREARRAIEESPWRISFPVEVRIVPADDVPLSTAYQRDTVYLAFHTHRDADHSAYFSAMERIMLDHGGRPHWGKLHSLGAAELADAYPRFGDFLSLRDRLDPDRVFANDHLRRLLGD
jgi:FAD-linked oxidoreductase